MQLDLPAPETVGSFSPESCDAVNERRLRGMAFLPTFEEEEGNDGDDDGTFRTPVETIDAIESQSRKQMRE